MQYFIKKNSSKKENHRKKYIIYRITSHKNINHESITYNRFMSEEIHDSIFKLIKETPNKTLKEYREILIKNSNDTITYDQINIVIALYENKN